MFGLTKREQRWKAEQQAAETVLGFAAAVVQAQASVDGDELARLRAENERLNEQRREWQAERETLLDRLARCGVEARREERERIAVEWAGRVYETSPEDADIGASIQAGRMVAWRESP